MKKNILLMLMSVLIITVFTGCGSEKFDFKEYSTVVFYGYNGYGSAKISFDEIEDAEIPNKFYSGILYSVSQKENLKNGDEVTLKFTYDEDYAKDKKIEVKNTEYTIVVSGLAPTEEVDAFDGITIACVSDGTKNKPVIERTENVLSELKYEIVNDDYKKTNYQNGDIITVKAKISKGTAEKNGIYIVNSKVDGSYVTAEKEYTLKGFNEYLNNIGQIKGAEWIEQLKSNALDGAKSYTDALIANSTTFLGDFSKQNLFSTFYGSNVSTSIKFTSAEPTTINSVYLVTYEGSPEKNCIYIIMDATITGSSYNVESQQLSGKFVVYYNQIMFNEDMKPAFEPLYDWDTVLSNSDAAVSEYLSSLGGEVQEIK